MSTLRTITSDHNILLCHPGKENTAYGAILVHKDQLLFNQDDFDHTTIEFTTMVTHRDLKLSHHLTCFQTGLTEWLVFYRNQQTGAVDQCLVLMTHNLYDDFEALYNLDERIGRQSWPGKLPFPIYNAWVNYE